jgi:protein-S-isoprenylcysteine O-methyltransferase Ste14
MNKMLEDRIGKLLMLLIFGFLLFRHMQQLVAVIMHRDVLAFWQLLLISKVSGLIFLLLIVYYTATRLPPRNSATGVGPRLTAICGTFVMMSVLILPAADIGYELRLISTGLIILGTILSVYCIWHLGRSFSIMATARNLVTEGPYSLVRHPLYAAELVTIVGVVIGNWSVSALAVGAIWLGLQIRRAHNEEAVLREAFPEYTDYAARVPMMVPGLVLPTARRT